MCMRVVIAIQPMKAYARDLAVKFGHCRVPISEPVGAFMYEEVEHVVVECIVRCVAIYKSEDVSDVHKG